MLFLEILSILFGWIYTICWSLSFYPQPILNFRKKSTAGTTVDFPFINILGFVAYFIYTLAFYCSPVIRHQYALRNHGHTPTVAFNDIAFAGHAVVTTLILNTQYFAPSLWGFERAPGRKPSRSMMGVFAGSVLAVVIIVLVVASKPADADPRTAWAWIDVVYVISYVKLVVTVVKYAPQLVHNSRNRSTKGWSILQILFDFTGGVLSIAQLGIDSYLQHDWSGVTGNPVKFALGNVSMLYDLGFMAQHYILYRGDSSAKDGERDSLLERGEEDRRLD
ncbi:PQ loop repeat-domain-containing protein [Xylariomycetidae sp. FL0641]|nr:PQ loop repeat-domain-containing protein [Xylariomycetidae sp. FL0641]